MRILLGKKLGKNLNKKIGKSVEIQCGSHNGITLGQIKSYNNINRMIQLTDKNVFMKTKENGDKQPYLEFFKLITAFLQSFNSDYRILIRFLDIIQNIFIFTMI
jgi:hypothetical protein